MSELPPLSPVELKDIRIRLVEKDIDRFQSLTLDLFKWIAAATLTLNGGPILAMLGSDKLRALLPTAGFIFALGVAASVLGNLLLIKGIARAGGALFDAHWKGESFRADNFDDVSPDSNSNRWTVVASVLLGLSVVFLIFGMLRLGTDLEKASNVQPIATESARK